MQILVWLSCEWIRESWTCWFNLVFLSQWTHTIHFQFTKRQGPLSKAMHPKKFMLFVIGRKTRPPWTQASTRSPAAVANRSSAGLKTRPPGMLAMTTSQAVAGSHCMIWKIQNAHHGSWPCLSCWLWFEWVAFGKWWIGKFSIIRTNILSKPQGQLTPSCRQSNAAKSFAIHHKASYKSNVSRQQRNWSNKKQENNAAPNCTCMPRENH